MIVCVQYILKTDQTSSNFTTGLVQFFMNKSLCKTDCFSDRNSRRIPMQSVKFRPEKLKNTEVSSY